MTSAQLRIGYVGNFRPEHSTENHVGDSLRTLGHTVVPLQEDASETWERLGSPGWLELNELDLVLWTRTWSLPQFPQLAALDTLAAAGVGTVGFHLDRWWGLDREVQVATEPFFRCRLMVTADGDPGHAERFRAAGVDHVWSPPAVHHVEATRIGRWDRTFSQRPLVFVGSWNRYHAEWPYRLELVEHLRRSWRGQLALWPRGHGIRGQELANLYTSAKVIVGDSCLAGGVTHYWSDRIPETLGRGGFLIHPDVEGLESHYSPGVHLVTYPLGDWKALDDAIGYYLAHDDERDAIAAAGRLHVQQHHTYRHRMATVVDLAKGRHLIRSLAHATGTVTVAGPRDTRGRFALRDGSSDGLVVNEVWREDIYQLHDVDVANGVVVDVGANVGAFTVWAAAAGATRVHAYEPELANFHRLCDNVALNDLDGRVECWREAVWTQGVDNLWVDVPDSDGSRATTREDPPSGLLVGPEDQVTARALTFVLQRAGDRIRLLKMDCEGCEWYALLFGMDPQDLARVDHLVLEFHGDGMGVEDSRFSELVGLLAEWGSVSVIGRPSVGGTLWWKRY